MNGSASCTTSCSPSPPSTGSPPPATSSSSKATPTASASAPAATQLDRSRRAPQNGTAAARWSLGRGNALVPWSWQMTCDHGRLKLVELGMIIICLYLCSITSLSTARLVISCAPAAWKAMTGLHKTSDHAGHHDGSGLMSDGEYPCLTVISGTRRARPSRTSGGLVVWVGCTLLECPVGVPIHSSRSEY